MQHRITPLNDQEARPDGSFVLYWMVANRRPTYNFALQHAVDLARKWDKPLLVLEALRAGYEWASDRLHRFVIDGMLDNQAYFEGTQATYYPYLEPKPGDGKGLIEELGQLACAVVTDDFPCFFLPHMQRAVAPRLKVAFEMVDSNGLFPMRAAQKVHLSALDFRRMLQRELAPYLEQLPTAEPLKNKELKKLRLPATIRERWPEARLKSVDLADFPIDHSVGPVDYRGGFEEGKKVVTRFLRSRLEHYEERNRPDREVASGLSPYLHFGHVSVHQVLRGVAQKEEWSPAKLSLKAKGAREGWWGMSKPAEGFLDEIVTWRELGYNMCWQDPNYEKYSSLPEWARKSLAEHKDDPRDPHYTLAQMEAADTYDEVWNATQRQLMGDGRIHNYLRMLWGKKILEWSSSPEHALEVMVHLNNKYGVDGRNPNSYSGIMWILGRYDRPWFERPIFGVIRYMSSESAKRKFKLDGYLDRWGK